MIHIVFLLLFLLLVLPFSCLYLMYHVDKKMVVCFSCKSFRMLEVFSFSLSPFCSLFIVETFGKKKRMNERLQAHTERSHQSPMKKFHLLYYMCTVSRVIWMWMVDLPFGFQTHRNKESNTSQYKLQTRNRWKKKRNVTSYKKKVKRQSAEIHLKNPAQWNHHYIHIRCVNHCFISFFIFTFGSVSHFLYVSMHEEHCHHSAKRVPTTFQKIWQNKKS